MKMKKKIEFLLPKEFVSSMMNNSLLCVIFLYIFVKSGSAQADSAQVLSYKFSCMWIYKMAKIEDLFRGKNVKLGDFNEYLFLFQNHPT